MERMLAALAAILFSTASLTQNNRLLDHPMQIKKIKMTVEADCFTAVTVLEMEFYNPNKEEIEGLYRFNLLPGQVVTAFQLELNGKYRDGSIEEKWKARNAYNTIVGKRIDPALLTLEHGNSYRLNIYPVPAKSSRKITMTIHQTLKDEKGKLFYHFSFNKRDTAKKFELSIKTNGCSKPKATDGLIANEHFTNNGNAYHLVKNSENAALWPGVRFYFEALNKTAYCTQTKEGQTYFALRTVHKIEPQSALAPKRIRVYWDASGSSGKRNTSKEISFLKQYMEQHLPEELIITKFSDEVSFSIKFYPRRSKEWISYLQFIQYDGATRMDHLDLGNTAADVIFLFSDGFVSFGIRTFSTPEKPLYAMSSSFKQDSSFLKALVGQSGGAYINLNTHSILYAVQKASLTSNQLLSIESATGKTVFETATTMEKNLVFVFGTLPADDTLLFVYGNKSTMHKTEKIVLKKNANCTAVGIDRLSMLHRYATINQWYDWEELLEFGIRERVVTTNTAYIVLERVEDYVKYNIAPPKELEEQCKQQGYVTKDIKTRWQILREMDAYQILNGVVNVYNQKLRLWDENSPSITLPRQDFEQNQFNNTSNSVVVNVYALSGKVPGITSSNLDEVVVTSYGVSRRREIGFSSTTVRSEGFVGNSIEQALAGKVPGLLITSGGSVFDTQHHIRIRGAGSFSGNNQPLIVLNGFPVEGNVNNFISINDIENTTVLKAPSAAAIYGSRAANGVIIINSKKYTPSGRYHNNNQYRLKDMDDVDYLKDIKAVPVEEKLGHYQQLRGQYDADANFYVDMAQHFFESGLIAEANNIILNAAEASNGDADVLKAIGYTFEQWKQFDKAAEVYQHILHLYPEVLDTHRDLAWALYQNGQLQKSIETFYAALKINFEDGEFYYRDLKASMLKEMNAIISIHKENIDVSIIPPALLTSMPADLRIVLSSNTGHISDLKIKEPDGKICSWNTKKTAGRIDVNGYYSNTSEYYVRHAIKGKYRITVNYNPYYSDNSLSMVRIVSFKNFGKKDQSISIQNVIMNNQYGQIEIGTVEW